MPRRTLEPMEREAHAWVRRLMSGEATLDDAEALKRWQHQSAAHAEAFAEASRLWQSFGPAGQNLLQRSGAMAEPSPQAEPGRRVGRRVLLGGGLAAAAAAAGAAIWRPPFALWPSWSELAADYRTSTGEQRRIALASSVSVQLNTQTSITVLSAAADRIELISGEAAITTRPDAAKPFTVIAAAGRTVAGQATFEVRYLGSQVCVTCLAGAVRVERGNAAVAVQEKQQLVYTDRLMGKPVTIDPAVTSAWREGLLIFRYTPLTQVVAEVNRYRPGRIVVLNAELGHKLVNGRFHIDRIDEVLVQLQQAFGAQVTSLPGGIVLLS
jgi:transmembrane sensor